MYTGKAMVHLSDVAGSQKHFILENNFDKLLTSEDEERNKYFEKVKILMKHNLKVTEIIQGKHVRRDVTNLYKEINKNTI